MNVEQLIKKLEKLDQNTKVILSSDSEGNSYGELETISNGGLHYARFIERYEDEPKRIEREIELGDLCDFKPARDYTKPKKCIVLYPA